MIRIYGASDDLVEIEGHNEGDEIGCYKQAVYVILGGADTGGIAVRMSYAPHFSKKIGQEVGFACWSAEVVQLAESCPIPWPVSIVHTTSHGIGYSVEVRIDAPADVPMRVVLAPVDAR